MVAGNEQHVEYRTAVHSMSVQRLGAPQTQPAIHGARHRPGRLPHEEDLLGELVVIRHQDAADDVGVAVQVLGGGVHG